MSETFRTLINGLRQDVDGNILDHELNPLPLCVGRKTITGTQLQSLGTTAQVVVATVSGRATIPIAWYVRFDHAGGTDFSGNVDVLLFDTDSLNTLGQATAAIDGSADKCTTGTIATTSVTTTGGMSVRVNTGDPTGGHATAQMTVQVWYVLVS